MNGLAPMASHNKHTLKLLTD